jgi:hypothetical protein
VRPRRPAAPPPSSVFAHPGWAWALRESTQRAATRVQQLQAEAATTFGVPLPAFVPPDLDLGLARVSFAYPRLTLLAEQLTSASWRLLGARAARARAVAKAREQAALAASLIAAVERGGGLLADAQDHRNRRTAELDRVTELLRDVETRLQPSAATAANRSAG